MPKFSMSNKIYRQLWKVVYFLFFRFTPRPFHPWRVFLLKIFGSSIGVGCHVYPDVQIWNPMNLKLGNNVCVGDGVYLYSMNSIIIDDNTIISQRSFLCCGSHDYNSIGFELITKPIHIGTDVWICSEVFIHPGVKIANAIVVGSRSVVVKDLEDSFGVYAGNPAIKIKKRMRLVQK